MDEHSIPESWRIPDELWDTMSLLLPEHKNTHRFGGGRPRTPDRVCMEAILFVLRTGCQWKALDATKFCPGSTAHDRFQQWVQAGVFLAMWEAGLMAYDDLEGIDWNWLSWLIAGNVLCLPLGIALLAWLPETPLRVPRRCSRATARIWPDRSAESS